MQLWQVPGEKRLKKRCLMRSKCRVADGRYPLLLSSSPGSRKSQFLSHLNILCYNHHLPQFSHFGWLWSENPSSAPEIWKHSFTWMDQLPCFGSGYSRRFFSQAGLGLRELHSLLRPTFLSGLSTFRTAPNTARPPPTAPGATLTSVTSWEFDEVVAPSPYTRFRILWGLILYFIGSILLSEIDNYFKMQQWQFRSWNCW